MAKIVTMGEIMLRLSSPNHSRITQSKEFDVCYGGGEANVAVSLAHYGHDVYFVSKIPNNEIGDSAIKALLSENVKVDYVVRGGNRLGIYFLESGSSSRASKVIYDRAFSAIAESKVSEYELRKALKGASVFHFSGITPALSDNCAKLVEKACSIAKSMGVLVSCDLNFRKKTLDERKGSKRDETFNVLCRYLYRQ